MNSAFLKSAPLLLAAGLALGGASAAHAQLPALTAAPVTINYSVGTFNFATPDYPFTGAAFKTDSPSTQSVMLTPGVANTVNFQSVYLDVYPTNGSTDIYTGTVSQTLTIDGITHSITQAYKLTTAPPDFSANTLYANDSLIFTSGPAVSYNLGSQGVLQFTPQEMDGSGIFNADSSPDGNSNLTYLDNVHGTFVLMPAAVPEASTTVSFGLLLGGLGLLAARSRKRAAAKA